MQKKSLSTWIAELEGYLHKEALVNFATKAQEALAPAGLIAFGSLARGNFYQSSDADICIVLQRDEVHPIRYADDPRLLDPSGIIEPVVFGRRQFLSLLKEANPLILEIVCGGIFLGGDEIFYHQVEETYEEVRKEFQLEKTASGWIFHPLAK